MVDTVGTASWEVRGRVAGRGVSVREHGIVGVSFRDFHAQKRGILLDFLGEQSKQSQGPVRF